jgi:hypothetical protein
MDVHGVYRQDTVMEIGVGRGDHLHDELTCRACGAVYGAAVGEARPVRDASGEDAAALATRTGPWGPEAVLDRLELERRLRADAVDADERKWLMGEPIARLEYAARLVATPETSVVTGLVIALVLVGVIATPMIWYFTPVRPRGMNAVDAMRCWGVTGGTTAMLVVAGLLMRWDRVRVRRRLVIRPLRRAFGGLRASDAEVAAALGEAGAPVLRGVRVEEVIGVRV